MLQRVLCTEWNEMGENFANHISGKELIPRIYTNQNKTLNNLIQKCAKDLNKHFSSEDMQKPNKPMKRRIISLIFV